MHDTNFFLSLKSSDNVIHPPIHLEGKWEVALVDIDLSTPHSSKIKSNVTPSSKSVETKFKTTLFPQSVNEGKKSLYMNIHIDMRPQGILVDTSYSNSENQNLRAAWQKYHYGNTRAAIQSSDYDKWNYKLPWSSYMDNLGLWIRIDAEELIKKFTENVNREFLLSEIVELLNADVMKKSNEIKEWLKKRFKSTGGEVALTTALYFTLPLIKIEGDYLSMDLPYYMDQIIMNREIAAFFGFKGDQKSAHQINIYSRYRYEVPNTLTGSNTYTPPGGSPTTYYFNRYKYYVFSPATKLRVFKPTTTISTTTGGSISNSVSSLVKVVLKDVIEETMVGTETGSILRMITWDEAFKQFNNLMYIPLRYSIIDALNIEITDLYNNTSIKTNSVTLHFRRIIE